jgi:N-acetylneuraminic acid mutarotase
MTDLHERFATLDGLRAPSLWHDIQVRATTSSRFSDTRFGLTLVIAAALIAGILGGAVLVGSGMSRATPKPTASERPSPTARSSATIGPTRATGWTRTSQMLDSRIGHTATLLRDGRVLVVGGLTQAFGAGLASAELYDPRTGAWTATGNMQEGRSSHSATLLDDGTVLVVGGAASNDGTSNEQDRASAEVYDPVTGAWTATAAPSTLGGQGVLLADGRVLVTGGIDARTREHTGRAELYDPVTRTWSDAESTVPLTSTAALLPDGRVLIVVDGGSSRTWRSELFDPATETWTAGPSLPERFAGGAVVVLADGRVLLAGGSDPSGPGAHGAAPSAIFDPATGRWRLTASMVMARLGHAATLLPDGRVLVTGGKAYGAPESPRYSSVELYDPATESWTLVGDMWAARDAHTATLLPDGRVLVTGGESRGGDALDAAELFVPEGAS